MFSAIASFVASGIASHALSKSLDWITEKTKQDFEARITEVINKTIDQLAKDYPKNKQHGKHYFFESQMFMEALLKYRLFGVEHNDFSLEDFSKVIQKDENIILPNEKELTSFFTTLDVNIKGDEKLKTIFVEDNYKEEIFKLADLLKSISQKLNVIEDKTDRIDKKADKILEVVTPNGTLPKELTANINRIPKRKIVGRVDDLIKLRNSLLENKRTVLLNGMGGIGKTTLAAVYVDEFWEEYNYIAWLTLNAETDLAGAISASSSLVNNLGLKNIPPKELPEICMNELNKIDEDKCGLLVIDNANSGLKDYSGILPKPPKWHVLVTARERIEKFETIELGFLSETEAVELFKKHCSLFNDDEIKQIVIGIEYHTLTIEMLAKGAEKNKWNFETLKNALALDKKINIEAEHSPKKIERITTYLIEIFKLNHPTANELYLLKQFLALPNEWLGYDSLCALLQVNKLEWKEDFAGMLEDLYEKGLLQKNDDKAYKMHPILTEALTKDLKPIFKDLKLLIEAITGILRYEQTKDNPVEIIPFIPFGEAVLKHLEDDGSFEISELLNNTASLLQENGKYKRAKIFLEIALASDEKNYGKDHPTVAVSKSNLALVYQALGDYSRARELLEEALASDEKNFRKDHPAVAVRQSNLALVYQDLGDYSRARELLEEVLESNEKNYGEVHPYVVQAKSNLALVYQDLGDYSRARELLEEALVSAEKNYGKDHPTVAVRQSNLALVYQALGDYSRARELLEEALVSAEKNYGKDHPTVATSKSNLALVYQALGDYSRARELLEEALASDEKNYGKDHPSVARCQNNLAHVYCDLVEYQKAIDLWEKSYKVCKNKLGEEHPKTILVKDSLEQANNILNKLNTDDTANK